LAAVFQTIEVVANISGYSRCLLSPT